MHTIPSIVNSGYSAQNSTGSDSTRRTGSDSTRTWFALNSAALENRDSKFYTLLFFQRWGINVPEFTLQYAHYPGRFGMGGGQKPSGLDLAPPPKHGLNWIPSNFDVPNTRVPFHPPTT